MLIRDFALSSDAADRVADRQTVPHAIDTSMVLICVILITRWVCWQVTGAVVRRRTVMVPGPLSRRGSLADAVGMKLAATLLMPLQYFFRSGNN